MPSHANRACEAEDFLPMAFQGKKKIKTFVLKAGLLLHQLSPCQAMVKRKFAEAKLLQSSSASSLPPDACQVASSSPGLPVMFCFAVACNLDRNLNHVRMSVLTVCAPMCARSTE